MIEELAQKAQLEKIIDSICDNGVCLGEIGDFLSQLKTLTELPEGKMTIIKNSDGRYRKSLLRNDSLMDIFKTKSIAVLTIIEKYDRIEE
jgi:hypothetical protein